MTMAIEQSKSTVTPTFKVYRFKKIFNFILFPNNVDVFRMIYISEISLL